MGARQIGKTTLAHQIIDLWPSLDQQQGEPFEARDFKPFERAQQNKPTRLYLDMENPSDFAKMIDPEAFLESQSHSLIVIDEIQAKIDLFPILRALIDQGIRRKDTRKYLLLGSASASLLRNASQTLTGRADYVHMSGLKLGEVAGDTRGLWLKGGYPQAYLAASEDTSLILRESLIQSIFSQDVPSLEPTLATSVPSLRRFWQMLAHVHGQPFNAANLAKSLAVNASTVTRYRDLFEAMDLLRVLPAWAKNDGKRLTKSPRVYIRDTGLLHALLKLSNFDLLFGHPVYGSSWEGFVLEQTLPFLAIQSRASYYRTPAGAEVDLVIEGPHETWAVEIKASSSPKLARGFQAACDHIKPTRKVLVYSGLEPWAVSDDISVLPLETFVQEVRDAFGSR